MLRVVKELPQEHLTSVVVYSGWMLGFMSPRSFRQVVAGSPLIPRRLVRDGLGREPEPVAD
ncbi:hypothetical protein TPA0907_03650 [Micromonospora humidisoli]|nr:hypothetical protein TPA0907_03650 [Micromonospora sp. AKA109]